MNEKKVKLTGNKYKSVTQMVNKLASPKFKKEWRELNNAREVKAWAVKRYNYTTKEWDLVKMWNPEDGYAVFQSEDGAKFCKGMAKALTGGAVKEKVIRVSIKEIK